MNTIEQAREVSLRLKRAPLQNGSNFHSEAADTIDALLAELAALSLDLHTETAAVIALRAELAALKGQQPVQWQKRHQSRTDGLWENTNEHDAKWWRDNAKGWEVRPLFLAAGAQPYAAYNEAKRLAEWLFKTHFAKDEDYASGRVVWEVCDTTAGIISQIDNMVCGLVMPVQAQERKPLIGWEATRIDEYEIRVVSPEGEAWRLRSADANDIFSNFIFRWAEAMLTAKEQP